ncbi:hypothetical protein [Streptomyces sp. NPDC005209]|uniref:hypothetical protein n=1 Tax=Streptomyces sp. NPDC005209 TaxID=3156715 RepID=UPI0033A01337
MRAPRAATVPHSPHSSKCPASTRRFVLSRAAGSSGCPAGSRSTTIRRAARTRERMTEGGGLGAVQRAGVRRAALQGEIPQPGHGIRLDRGPHPAPSGQIQNPVGTLARRADGRGDGGDVVEAALRRAQGQGERQQREEGGPGGEHRTGPHA